MVVECKQQEANIKCFLQWLISAKEDMMQCYNKYVLLLHFDILLLHYGDLLSHCNTPNFSLLELVPFIE